MSDESKVGYNCVDFPKCESCGDDIRFHYQMAPNKGCDPADRWTYFIPNFCPHCGEEIDCATTEGSE